jgi:hypothetical protein
MCVVMTCVVEKDNQNHKLDSDVCIVSESDPSAFDSMYLDTGNYYSLRETFNFKVNGSSAIISVRGDQSFANYRGVEYQYEGNGLPDFHKHVSWSYMSNPKIFWFDCMGHGCEFDKQYFILADTLNVQDSELQFALRTNEIVNNAGGSYRIEERTKIVRYTMPPMVR